MDIRAATSAFVTQGRDLFHLLRSDGLDLSEAELIMLRVQLHIIDNEATMIQNIQRFIRSKDPALSQADVNVLRSREKHS